MSVQMRDLKGDNMVLNPQEKGKWLARRKQHLVTDLKQRSEAS